MPKIKKLQEEAETLENEIGSRFATMIARVNLIQEVHVRSSVITL